MEFIRVVDQEFMGLPTADLGWPAHAPAVAAEEESRLITSDATLSAEEVASQVHDFVGCSIGRLLNDKSSLRINKLEEQDNSTCTGVLESMSAAKEECLNAVPVGETTSFEMSPKECASAIRKKRVQGQRANSGGQGTF